MFRLAAISLLLILGCKEPPRQEVPEPVIVEDLGAPATIDFGVATEDVGDDHEQHSFLWRVSADGKGSWIFGTIHGGVKADWAHLPPDVQRAMQRAETIVFETDVANVDPSAVAGQLTLPKTASLRSQLGEERFDRLAEYTGHPVETLDRYRPWVVHGELVSRWLPDERPVDSWMMIHAREREKKLDYLESPLDQMAALDRAITADVLGRTIDNLDEEERSMIAAVQQYRAGDVDALRSNLFDPADVTSHEAMYDALFRKRNEVWFPKVKKHVETGGALIVVGAGHLIGPHNLLEMLRDAGYRVEASVYSAPVSTFSAE